MALAAGLVLVLAPTAFAGKVVDSWVGGTGTGVLQGQFNMPSDVAVDASSGNFYVADSNNHRVQRFSATGEFELMWGRGVDTGAAAFEVCTAADVPCQAGSDAGDGQGEFDNPTSVAVAPDGAVYVYDRDNQRVQKFTTTAGGVTFVLAFGKDVNQTAPGDVCPAADDCQAGTPGTGAAQFGATATATPRLVVDPARANDVIVGDGANRRLLQFASDGTFVRGFGHNVDSAGGDGALEICVASCQAGTLPGFGKTPIGQFPTGEPAHLALGANGILYAVDPGSGFIRFPQVHRFDITAATAATLSAGAFDQDINNEYLAVEVDGASGRLLAGVEANRVEERDAATGTSPALIDTHLQGSGIVTLGLGADEPSTAAGRVYVASLTGGHRVYIGDQDGPPIDATIADPEDVTATGATLRATINPNGFTTSYRFEYSSNGGSSWTPVKAFEAIGSGTSDVEVDDAVSGLTPGTAYLVRLALQRNFGVGVTTSAPVAFETEPAPPAIGDVFVDAVGLDRARVNATINPNNAASTYQIRYGTTASYGQQTAPVAIPAGPSGVKVSRLLQSLEPGTVYHYQVVATNDAGATEGSDRTFRTFAPPPADTDCPNQRFRVGPSAVLPDCRAYEMVSPVDKNGGDIAVANELFNGSDGHVGAQYRQAAVAGGKITYSAATAFADAPGGHYSNQYLSTRGAGGWATHGISARRHRTVFDPNQGGPLASPLNYKVAKFFQGFSDDLSSAWVRDDNFDPLAPGALQHYVNLYRRDNVDGSYHPLTNEGPYDDPRLELTPTEHAGGLQFAGASEDLSHQVFAAGAALTPDAFAPASGGSRNQIYDLVDGELHLVSVLPNGTPYSVSHAGVGTQNISRSIFTTPNTVTNAVANDGSRIFWTAPQGTADSGPGAVYVRLNPDQGQSAVAGGECTEPGKACTIPVSGSVTSSASRFLGASGDGSKALFSHGSPGSLYVFDVDSRTPTLIASQVLGVSGFADGLSHVFFVSRQALADGAVAGQPNLYDYSDGGYTLVAVASEDDVAGVVRTVGGAEAGSGSIVSPQPRLRKTRVSEDGRFLAFESNSAGLAQAVANYDNTDLETGVATFQVYLYDAVEGDLTCVSCKPSGGRPVGSVLRFHYSPFEHEFSNSSRRAGASLPTHEQQLHASRLLSDGGGRLFFHSDDALVAHDTNGAQDVYQWQAPGTGSCVAGEGDYSPRNEGCVSLISTGKDPSNSEFVDASANGDEVFFATNASIDPRDPTSRDIYVAKVRGGFPLPPQEGRSCDVQAGDCQGAEAPAVPASARTGAPLAGGDATARPRKRIAVAVPRRARRAAARRGVLAVAVRSSRPGMVRVSARARIGGRVRRIGAGAVRVRRAGRAVVRLRLSRAAQQRLRSGRALRVRLRAASPGARARTATVVLAGARR